MEPKRVRLQELDYHRGLQEAACGAGPFVQRNDNEDKNGRTPERRRNQLEDVYRQEWKKYVQLVDMGVRKHKSDRLHPRQGALCGSAQWFTYIINSLMDIFCT